MRDSFYFSLKQIFFSLFEIKFKSKPDIICLKRFKFRLFCGVYLRIFLAEPNKIKEVKRVYSERSSDNEEELELES